MTQLSRRTITCPKCSTSFSIVYFTSINTWLDPSLAKKFLEGQEYLYDCPNCKQSVRLITTIIVNARKGMFNISTDASLEERRSMYQKYGLLNKKGEFGNPQEEWLLHEFTKMSAPNDTTAQIRNQNKLLQDITNKIKFYKEKLGEAMPLSQEDETEFKLLKRRWEKEKQMGEAYLHPPGYLDKNTRKNVLFYELWVDLLKLKDELKKLK